MDETVLILNNKIEDIEVSKNNTEAYHASKEKQFRAKEKKLETRIESIQSDKVEVEKEVDFLDSLLPTKDKKIE